VQPAAAEAAAGGGAEAELAALAGGLSLEPGGRRRGGLEGGAGGAKGSPKGGTRGKGKQPQKQRPDGADAASALNANVRSGKRPPAPAPEPGAAPPARWRQTRVVALADDVYARYRDAIVGARGRVHTLSGGRVGYLHLPDCERLGYAELQRHYLPEAGRAALVLDVRSNGGGMISELVLAQLAQVPPRRAASLLRPLRGRRGLSGRAGSAGARL
jgi:hypothetical protein